MHLCIHSCWYDISINYTGWWYTYPSENMSSSVGIILPNIWKNHPNVPNHLPDIIRVNILIIIYYMYLCIHSWCYDTSINYTLWWFTHSHDHPWPQRTSLVVLGCPGPQRLALQRSLAAVSGWLHWIALDQGPVAGEKTWGIFWGKSVINLNRFWICGKILNRTSQISWNIVLFLRLFCGPLRGSYKVPTWRCVGTGNVEAFKWCYHRDEGQ